jgi:hypothetical protein
MKSKQEAAPSKPSVHRGELLLGNVEPRIFTPSLVELTPETSYGYDVIRFARDVLKKPLLPWQEWLVIRAGELLPDGTPRFRKILILVARQNGKTFLLMVLALYWLFAEQQPMVFGMSSTLEYAKESWSLAVAASETIPELVELMPTNKSRGVLRGNNNVVMETAEGCKYKIGAANRKGGRSLTINRLVMDELREQHNHEAWGAAVPATGAVPDAQIFCISNQGDDKSVVLNQLYEEAIDAIEDTSGDADESIGLFEWSALPGAAVDDREGWKAANPSLGYHTPLRTLLGEYRSAKKSPEAEAYFRTNYLCQRVKTLNGAIDPLKWTDCFVAGNMEQLKKNLCACIDVSPDMQHITLAVAAELPDKRIRVEVAKEWTGSDATNQMRKELPGLIQRMKPRKLVWIPNGPAAAITGDMAAKNRSWPPPGVLVEEIRAEVSAVCMGFADLVANLHVIHGGQKMLDTHVTSASKKWTGDAWRFERKGEGHCDAAYAVAGATHAVRTLPPSLGKARILTAK